MRWFSVRPAGTRFSVLGSICMTAEFSRGKAYVVDRGKPKLRSGQGMLAGLDVVIKHFVGAFGKKIENGSQTTGVFTVQYPEERLELPEAFRNFPILLF